MVAVSTICAKPKTSGKLYDLSLVTNDNEISFPNLKRNLSIYNKELIEYYKYFKCINDNYPENHANYRTYKELNEGNIDYTGNVVNGKTDNDAFVEYNNNIRQLKTVQDDILTIGNNIDTDFQKVNKRITFLNKNIRNLEKKIKPLKHKVNKLKSGAETSEGMLDNAQLIYNESFTAMILLGIITAGTCVAIYKNWSSMKT